MQTLEDVTEVYELAGLLRVLGVISHKTYFNVSMAYIHAIVI